jgi:hypothetical protein
MKISSKDLKDFYRDYSRGKILMSKETCPSPDLLIRLNRSKLKRKERNKVISHISRCHHCAEEEKLILDIIRRESDFIEEAANHLRSQPHAESKNPFPFFSRFALKPISAALFLIAFSGLLFFIIPRFKAISDIRRGNPTSIVLTHPANKTIGSNRYEFTWQGPKETKYYIIEVYDSSLELIWTSGSIETKRIAFPDDLMRNIKANQPYFWGVSAILKNYTKIKSKLAEFKIKE